MNATGYYLPFFIFLTFFYYSPVSCALCCQTSTTNSSNDTRETRLEAVRALDSLHKHWIKFKLLEGLRVDYAPPEAVLWRRRRDQRRRGANGSVSGETSTELDSNEQAERSQSIRRYTLRVSGVKDVRRRSSGRHHAHRGRRNRHANANDNIPCAKTYTYEFKARLPSVQPTFSYADYDYETVLDRARIEFARPNSAGAHTFHFDNEPDDGGWSSFRITPGRAITTDVQGRPGDENQNSNSHFFVEDVTNRLSQFWSARNGVNASVVFTVSQCGRTNENAFPAPPVLELHLVERAERRTDREKRNANAETNANSTSSPFRNRESTGNRMIIRDCDEQWDESFLRETPPSQYDGLMPCCRRRVRIDFAELEWDNWIIAPPFFDSYYCMGRCTSFGGFASEDTDGPAFYSDTMNKYRTASQGGLTPCCSPIKFSPLTVTVLSNGDEELTQTLEDVVVRQCGCM